MASKAEAPTAPNQHFAVVLNCPKGFASHHEARAWLKLAIEEIEAVHPEPATESGPWGTWLVAALLIGTLLLLGSWH